MCPDVLHSVFNDMVFNWSKGSHYSFLVYVSTSLCYMPVRIKRSKLQDLQQASPRERIPQISFEYLNNDFVLLFVLKRKCYSPLYLLGCKGGQCVRLRALPPSCADCLEILEASISCSPKGLSQAYNGIALAFTPVSATLRAPYTLS
jgi:hypothetical protein